MTSRMHRPRTVSSMRRRYAALMTALALTALPGCSRVGQDPPGIPASSEVEPDVAAPHDWQPVADGRARITDWHWQDPTPQGRQPQWGTWLVLDVEVQVTTSQVHVSGWNWRCLGAYDGQVAESVATPLDDIWHVTIPAGVSAMGRVACDPNPGQAVIVQWAQPDPQATVPVWRIPER